MISIERSSSNETRGGGTLPGQPRSVVEFAHGSETGDCLLPRVP